MVACLSSLPNSPTYLSKQQFLSGRIPIAAATRERVGATARSEIHETKPPMRKPMNNPMNATPYIGNATGSMRTGHKLNSVIS